ncbi:MAG: polysaccharide deacetylase family protein [Lysinibacillus sp.]
MKRVVVLFLFLLLVSVQQADANVARTTGERVPTFFITKQSAPVYDESGEVIGKVYSKQDYFYESKSTDCYYIEVENYLGCVPVGVAKRGSTMMIPEKLNRKGKMIYTTRRTDFTDEYGRLVYMSQANRRHYAYKEDKKFYYVETGGRVARVPKTHAAVDKGIPVLMYHHILKDSENKKYRTSTTISDVQFRKNVDILQEKGVRTITMDELYEFLQGKRNLGKNAVAITFDDGLLSNLIYAYPLLQSHGMKATNFVITSRVMDTPQYFYADNLQFISKEEMEWSQDVFHYEGHTHRLHDILDGKSLVVQQTMKSLKQDLETARSIVPQQYFAYPFGQYNETTKRVLRNMDYRLAFTTRTGYVKYGDDPYALNRIGIEPKTTEKQFREYLAY